jgi:hypothetical protein
MHRDLCERYPPEVPRTIVQMERAIRGISLMAEAARRVIKRRKIGQNGYDEAGRLRQSLRVAKQAGHGRRMRQRSGQTGAGK